MTAMRSRLMWTTSAVAALATMATTAPAIALNGTDAPAQLNFTAKINVGEQAACTGALVAPQWVLTAATCFSPDGKPAAGKPAVTTTVTVGRTDLAQTTVGSTLEAVQLVPRADRDVVLVKLASRVKNVTPVTIASAAPTADEQLSAAGFGRTKTTWVPDKLHTGTFTASSSDATTVALAATGDALICQGDTGGPLLRQKDGAVELLAIASGSWQGGCLGTDAAETRTNALGARVDDLGSWIADTVFARQGDLTGDKAADLAAVWTDGSLHVYTGSATQGLSGARTPQLGGTGWLTMKQLAKADFTNDGVADVMAIWNDGTLHLYKGDGNGSITAQTPIAMGGTTWGTTKQMTAADFTGDGWGDLLTVWNDGTLHLYRGDGKGNITAATTVAMGGSTWGTVEQFVGGDFDRDGNADLMAVWNDGTLHFYKSNGDGSFNAQKPVWGGNTWSTVTLMAGDDYSADGTADIMAIWGNGTLHLYKGTGNGDIDSGMTVPVGGSTWLTMKHLA
ncbi:FG-GAP-like repeat-containing protein [Streptomyces sp. NPDC056527]|uniref:FG-GAP-like repeat-containing protein n=1 Tax=Streptomyces sp. NPDC056527 TaxID=3345853 RepID=UPI0036C2E846